MPRPETVALITYDNDGSVQEISSGSTMFAWTRTPDHVGAGEAGPNDGQVVLFFGDETLRICSLSEVGRQMGDPTKQMQPENISPGEFEGGIELSVPRNIYLPNGDYIETERQGCVLTYLGATATREGN